MTSNRIDEMRLGRLSETVVLQEYNNFRSTRPGNLVFAFEGHDDVIFYEVMIEKCGFKNGYDSFVCKGKDRVLALRRLLSRNTSEDAKKMAYFVDKDFDGLKSEVAGKNIFCTDSYSIENYLVDSGVLKKILRGEFRCIGDSSEDDILRAISFYDEMLNSFLKCMEEANFIIFFLRSSGLRGRPIENNVEKYVKISENGVEVRANTNEVIILVGAEDHLREEDLPAIKIALFEKFRSLEPTTNWRGKFNFLFFRKILKILSDDRGRRPPRIFATRKHVSAQFDGNIFRQLASAALPPESLQSFMTNINAT